MKYRDIIKEAKFASSRDSSRAWYNAKNGDVILVPSFTQNTNHSKHVVDNPEQYGLSPEDVDIDNMSRDYDGRILYRAMQNGWVRVRTDPRNPSISSNIEGANIRDIRKCLKWLVDTLGDVRQIVVVLRTGEGDQDGTAFRLTDEDEINTFIRWGKHPQNIMAA